MGTEFVICMTIIVQPKILRLSIHWTVIQQVRFAHHAKPPLNDGPLKRSRYSMTEMDL